MKLLITGGTGFFGKSILDYFDENDSGFDITIISRNGMNVDKYKNLSIAQVKSDVRDVKFAQTYDYVIHAATPAVVNITDEDMMSIIVDGASNLMRQVKAICPNAKVLFTSSGAVYGDYDRPASEEDECHPKSAYGKAKLEAERILLESDANCNIARCFAFSGKNLKQDIHFAIGNFAKNARENTDITIKSDGSSVRSYLDQRDLASQLMKILIDGKDKQIYNVGSDRAISIKDLAYLVRDTLNKNIDVKILGESNFSNSKSFYVPNVDKIKRDLGCVQTISLEDSLREMYNI